MPSNISIFLHVMDFSTFLLLISIFTFALTLTRRARRSPKLPPGPFRLPIIGNILDLGPEPHRSLTKLSKKYGPLMSLKLGSRTTIVVSSPEMAKVVLQKHDIAFCGRTVPSSVKSVDHEKFSLAWLPAEAEWRNLRKICREQLFSAAKLDASHGLRKEKLQKLLDYVRECSEMGRVVDLGTAAFTTTLNLISASLFSVEFGEFNSETAQEMKDAVWAIQIAFGTPNLADFFPSLEAFDPQGISKQLKVRWDKLSKIFDGIIDEKLKSRSRSNDLLQALIDETELSRDGIKHLLLDLFVAGTDTSATTVEWAMAELLRKPDKMLRVRKEIKHVIKGKSQADEWDIESLPYLQAVVKETLRVHPPAPFLLPHKAVSDVVINGYLIPKNAQILTNVWASSKDPDIWMEADEFMPERFLAGKHDHTDLRGKHFELIPFGSGRRSCPGFPLAYRMVHLMLATFAGNFEWKLNGGMKPEELDMQEKTALTLQKAIPLEAVPMPLD